MNDHLHPIFKNLLNLGDADFKPNPKPAPFTEKELLPKPKQTLTIELEITEETILRAKTWADLNGYKYIYTPDMIFDSISSGLNDHFQIVSTELT